MHRLSWVLCLFALFMIATAGTASAKGTELVIAAPSDAKSLDPHATPEAISQTVNRNIYESLVAYDTSMKIIPVLAERWEVSDDRKTYTFYLKKGVRFHNGEEMTAEDVIYSFKRVCGPEGAALRVYTMFIDPDKLEAKDDYTVVVHLKQPMGSTFLASMNHPWASILNKKAVESAGKDYGMNPVGTGKFKFESWAKGDRIVLTRFEDYHGEKAKLEKMIFRAVVEASSRTIELESGAVDLALDPATIDIRRIEESDSLHVHSLPGQVLFYLGFELNKAPYSDPRVREAFSLAVNRPGIVKAAFKGYAEPGNNPIPSSGKYSPYKELPQIPQDIEKAKALLKEAGYPNGFKGELLVSDRTDHMNVATVLQENFRRIGVDMEIKVYEWGVFMDIIRRPGHEPFILNAHSSAAVVNDPYFFLMQQFHSTAAGQTNRMYLRDKEVDAMLEKGAELDDGPEREAVYKKLINRLNEIAPWVCIASPTKFYGVRNGLEGIQYTPSSVNYFGDAYFK